MHCLGTSQDGIEGVHAAYRLEGLVEAQKRSWEALQDIADKLSPGLTEQQAIEIAYTVLEEMGSPRSWHRPIVRFGENTQRTYREKQQPDRVLKHDEMFLIDIGPTWVFEAFPGVEYEGDVGKTFVSGAGNAEQAHCIQTAQELFAQGCHLWATEHLSGPALYEVLAERATTRGLTLLVEANGHRIGDFPHMRFCSKGLTEITTIPGANLWVLEIHVVNQDRTLGAFFEDVLSPPPTPTA